ncbi:DeoR/GlpR family DNA-binding transcription regulator [Candidatus Epulonipiscium viviparus]|uniref:DeoR/GlpR family DNA-binding transcription regulator n=1 Tax=Candidatus Epulonipiscium viviparus TaxID=420336 RepID=UPI00273815AC|nr:DeoR/GlpR family DNA-binding transcription regulator [Candidatus Epulopiscium viviparus]
MKIQRINQIEAYILEKKIVQLDALCVLFGISKNTLRRDIDILVKKGSIAKVYGGVVAVGETSQLTAFEKRAGMLVKEKVGIAKCAATFVQDSDVIFIDTGTTTAYLINYLGHLNNLTIVTYNVDTIYKALQFPNLKLISLPGMLKHNTVSLVDPEAVNYLANININKAFVSCTGLSIANGICNTSAEEYIIKQAVVKKSKESYLLADHSKFDRSALMTYADIEDIEYLITDREPDAVYEEYLIQKSVNLIIS